jgi:cytochrome c peroxidase
VLRIVVFVVLAVVIVFGGLTGYLTYFDRRTPPELPAASATLKNPVALAAFDAFREARCDYCHAPNTELPFYFSLPVANQLMRQDLAQGPRHFSFAPVLKAFADGKPPGVEELSRIEEVIRQDRMPPDPYALLHWHARLSAGQRAAILTWIDETRKEYYATPGVASQFASEPVQPIPESVPVDWNKAALGRHLFFETKLSGDGTLNCASCHNLSKGGGDGLVTATGIHGQKGPINVPTVYNSVFSLAQFWNGRAASLAAQAAGPIMNPLEMGSTSWEAVAAPLLADPSYVEAFWTAFEGGAINEQTITEAIGEYERTLITPDGAFDRYLKGDANAITAQEKRGYARFKEIGCSGCHSGVAVGGDAFEIMGLQEPYFTDRHTPLTGADKGRFTFTNNPADLERFKVPNLRNVDLTAPYFHDGSIKTLDQAVREMARYQTPYPELPDQDVQDIVAFLRTLTGTFQGKPLNQVPPEPPLRPTP